MADAARRFRPRQLETAEGGRLRLRADGLIELADSAGAILGTWAMDDPEWARHAIRFGLHPQQATVAPHGGPDGGSKPPRT